MSYSPHNSNINQKHSPQKNAPTNNGRRIMPTNETGYAEKDYAVHRKGARLKLEGLSPVEYRTQAVRQA